MGASAVTPFSSDQWLVVLLVFVLGLLIGMWLTAGGKWKRRYREEVSRRETLEREEKTRRETLEREHKHREASDIAARAQADRNVPRA
jgi:C4-dicarboxylate-specific signal transduction histidine kinase